MSRISEGKEGPSEIWEVAQLAAARGLRSAQPVRLMDVGHNYEIQAKGGEINEIYCLPLK